MRVLAITALFFLAACATGFDPNAGKWPTGKDIVIESIRPAIDRPLR